MVTRQMHEDFLSYLKSRRTIPAAQLDAPGPDDAALAAMLGIAARVPDHGKLAPWRFIVYRQAERAAAVDGLVRIAARAADPQEARMRAEKARGFVQAPLVVGVVSAPDAAHPKIPVWEQQLSAGAVCMNLLHAAYVSGFAAQWLTGWYASEPEAARWLGLRDGEQVAGFIHIGTPAMPPTERDRPDVAELTSRWQPPAS